MKINIQSPGFKVNPQLNLFIQEKAEKLFNYYSDLISIEISLKISNSDTKENKVCEIRLVIPGNDILASAQCKTFEEAVDTAIDALSKQVIKHKEKIKSI